MKVPSVRLMMWTLQSLALALLVLALLIAPGPLTFAQTTPPPPGAGCATGCAPCNNMCCDQTCCAQSGSGACKGGQGVCANTNGGQNNCDSCTCRAPTGQPNQCRCELSGGGG
jgi:hypothetical protein